MGRLVRGSCGGCGVTLVGRARCAARSAYYTLRYWLRTGDLTSVVSGHLYGEPTYSMIGQSIEVETLRCSCGSKSEGWRTVTLR